MQNNFARASHLFLHFFAVTARLFYGRPRQGTKFFSLLTVPLSFLGIRESVTFRPCPTWHYEKLRNTQRDFSSKPLKHSIVKRILVFER